MFRTDVRQVFDIIRYSEEPEKLKELVKKETAYQNMEEDAYDMVAAYMHTEELVSMKSFHKKKGGKVDMCGAIAGLIAEGKMEGKLEGKLEGEEHKLVELVCKKLRKEKSAEVIAEELEEEPEKIQSICEAAVAYAPEFECDKVYQAWKTK